MATTKFKAGDRVLYRNGMKGEVRSAERPTRFWDDGSVQVCEVLLDSGGVLKTFNTNLVLLEPMRDDVVKRIVDFVDQLKPAEPPANPLTPREALDALCVGATMGIGGARATALFNIVSEALRLQEESKVPNLDAMKKELAAAALKNVDDSVEDVLNEWTPSPEGMQRLSLGGLRAAVWAEHTGWWWRLYGGEWMRCRRASTRQEAMEAADAAARERGWKLMGDGK